MPILSSFSTLPFFQQGNSPLLILPRERCAWPRRPPRPGGTPFRGGKGGRRRKEEKEMRSPKRCFDERFPFFDERFLREGDHFLLLFLAYVSGRRPFRLRWETILLSPLALTQPPLPLTRKPASSSRSSSIPSPLRCVCERKNQREFHGERTSQKTSSSERRLI